jgi:leader peptidase (prepilin peptidase)/N-methyltransferase
VTALAEVPWLFAALCGVLGLLIGSFLNVVIYRMPRIMRRHWAADAVQLLGEGDIRAELSLAAEVGRGLDAGLAPVAQALSQLPVLGLAQPRSRCSSCGHPISALENIPVLSWLALRGRCRACKTPISIRYPLVEVAVGILFALCGLDFGASVQVLAGFVISGFCVAMTLIDADAMLLPDALTLPLLWIGLLLSASGMGFVPLPLSVIGAAAGYGAFWLIGTVFRLVRGIEGMGAGDYKLLAALGAWFGWPALLPIVLLAAGVGSIVGVTLMLTGRANMLTRLPFGVYLAPAGVLMLFYGPSLTALLFPRVS